MLSLFVFQSKQESLFEESQHWTWFWRKITFGGESWNIKKAFLKSTWVIRYDYHWTQMYALLHTTYGHCDIYYKMRNWGQMTIQGKVGPSDPGVLNYPFKSNFYNDESMTTNWKHVGCKNASAWVLSRSISETKGSVEPRVRGQLPCSSSSLFKLLPLGYKKKTSETAN